MSALALLAELEVSGIHVTRDGDDLRVRAPRGINLYAFTERIKAQKPELLRELLQRRIVEALDVEPADFNRSEYDCLWAIWHTEDTKEESTTP